MTKPKPFCQSIYPWLKENLGKCCLGVLTGTDTKALEASVQIIALYAYDGDQSLIRAFGVVVRRMQPTARFLAYHAIAHVMDWHNRGEIWVAADLGDCPKSRCKHEPKPRVLNASEVAEAIGDFAGVKAFRDGFNGVKA